MDNPKAGQNSQASSTSRQSKAKNPIPDSELSPFIGFESEREMLVLLVHNENLVQAPELGPQLFGDATNERIYQTLVDYVEHQPDAYTEGHLIAYARRVPGLWEEIDAANRFVSLFGNIHPREDFDFLLSRLRYHLARRLAYLEHQAGIQALLADKNLDVNPAETFRKSADKIESLAPYCSQSRKLIGASILNYSKSEIDYSQNLLGNRWLERRAGAFIIAPSSHGKSTLTIQAAALWSCGKVAFGIKPAKPLRILIIQSEDPTNDVIEMAQICRRLSLSQDETALVDLNTHIERVDDVIGTGFFKVLSDFLPQFRPDIILINPYSAYLGGALGADELSSEFLRVGLQPLLNQHDCAALLVHHTPKTQYQQNEKFDWYDWMYTGEGRAVITNWARAILVVAPTKSRGIYRFIAAKRFEKIGWTEPEYWFAHSVENKVMLWIAATQEQVVEAGKNKIAGPEEVLTQIPALDPILQDELYGITKKKWGLGVNSTKSAVRILLKDGKIFKHSISHPGVKPFVGYAKTAPSDD